MTKSMIMAAVVALTMGATSAQAALTGNGIATNGLTMGNGLTMSNGSTTFNGLKAGNGIATNGAQTTLFQAYPVLKVRLSDGLVVIPAPTAAD